MHYRGVGFTYTKLGNNAQEVYLLLAMCFRKKKKRHPAWPLPPLRASASQPLQIRLFRAAQSRGRGLASLCCCQPEYSITFGEPLSSNIHCLWKRTYCWWGSEILHVCRQTSSSSGQSDSPFSYSLSFPFPLPRDLTWVSVIKCCPRVETNYICTN